MPCFGFFGMKFKNTIVIFEIKALGNLKKSIVIFEIRALGFV